MPPLTNYTPVPSGLSFDFNTAGPAPRRAYLLMPSGSSAVLAIAGTGAWTVEMLGSTDAVNFSVLGTRSAPGSFRFDTRGLAAVACRVSAYTSGTLTGMLAHGSPVPVTNVSPMFGASLIFSYNATAAEPPIGNQIRFNNTSFPAVTKVWIANTTNDGTDQFQALRKIPHGGTLLVQDRAKHADAILYRILAPPVDKTDYVELTVSYQEHTGALVAGQALVAVFNPGPTVSLNPAVGPAQEEFFVSDPLAPPAKERAGG